MTRKVVVLAVSGTAHRLGVGGSAFFSALCEWEQSRLRPGPMRQELSEALSASLTGSVLLLALAVRYFLTVSNLLITRA